MQEVIVKSLSRDTYIRALFDSYLTRVHVYVAAIWLSTITLIGKESCMQTKEQSLDRLVFVSNYSS